MVHVLELGAEVVGELTEHMATSISQSRVLVLDEIVHKLENGLDVLELVDHVLADLTQRHQRGKLILPVIHGHHLLDKRREILEHNILPQHLDQPINKIHPILDILLVIILLQIIIKTIRRHGPLGVDFIRHLDHIHKDKLSNLIKFLLVHIAQRLVHRIDVFLGLDDLGVTLDHHDETLDGLVLEVAVGVVGEDGADGGN